MENIRIQDDLYNYVNQEWLETAVIPDDKPSTGGFVNLGVGVEENLIRDFKEMISTDSYPNDYLRRACGVFKATLDVKARKKAGIKPALKTVARIDKLTNIASFNRNLKNFVLDGLPLPFAISVDPDMKNTDVHCLMFQGPSCILPDTSYYKLDQQRDAMLGLWSNMASQVLKFTKLSEEDQAKYVADTLAFDAIIATLVKSQEEWSEYTKCYNPMKTGRVNGLLKPVKFKKLLMDLYGFVPETVIVAEPRFLKGFNTLFNEETFVLYKHWAYVTELVNSCSVLSEELRVLGGSYQRALMGIAEAPSVEKFAYNLASHIFSEPVGVYYGEKYFGEEAKKDVVDMVLQIIDTYKDRVAKNEFLAQSTKDKAILKLSTMKVKMGYPDMVDPFYDKLVFDETASLYAITSELGKIRRVARLMKLTEPVNRGEWLMPGNMVNACYNPSSNDITFPAAILQAPFYSIKQTRSQNLGGIGAVIGHEISHAFDNNGSAFDEKGNLADWWTKEDKKNFKNRTKAMIKQFDGIELPWGVVNGAFIVSENIADNGGVAVTLQIMSTMKDANYEEYFTNWAKVWCMKGKPEYLALLLRCDVHGPCILRANMPPRNFEEWYTTYNVKKTDKMYIAPNKRVVIW